MQGKARANKNDIFDEIADAMLEAREQPGKHIDIGPGYPRRTDKEKGRYYVVFFEDSDPILGSGLQDACKTW